MTITVTTDRAGLYAVLEAWLVAFTGIPAEKVIWLNQEIERPEKPYAGMLIITRGNKTGTDDVIESFDVPSQKIQRITAGPRKMTVQVEVYTDPSTSSDTLEADELLENALLGLDTELIKDAFRAAKIGLLSQGDPQRLDEQLGDRWERRSMAELVITYSGETFDNGADSGNWVETVDYTLNAAE